jgi:hypothetical protein
MELALIFHDLVEARGVGALEDKGVWKGIERDIFKMIVDA